MSNTNRSFVLAYVFLVALPIVGLWGILRSGRHLIAPFSVDGAWKIEAADNHIPAPTCNNFLITVANSPLSISQSGKELVIGVNNGGKSANGTLEGKAIQASFAGVKTLGQADCAGQAWTLSATLDPQSEPKTLRGTLSVAGCASCVPLEFRATRQPRTAGGGAH